MTALQTAADTLRLSGSVHSTRPHGSSLRLLAAAPVIAMLCSCTPLLPLPTLPAAQVPGGVLRGHAAAHGRARHLPASDC